MPYSSRRKWGTGVRTSGQEGWAVLQTIIAIAIAVAVVIVAAPIYVSGARGAELQENAATLRLELATYLAQGLDPAYVPVSEESTATDSHTASAVFARALRGPRKLSAYYVNPFDGSRSVVCTPQLPSQDSPPAVWITDDQRYGYEAFRVSAENTARLRGTLVVAFLIRSGRTCGVDVYYVDRDGQRSATVGLLAP
jgi:hypothetical protein